jgi:hypothetical protein
MCPPVSGFGKGLQSVQELIIVVDPCQADPGRRCAQTRHYPKAFHAVKFFTKLKGVTATIRWAGPQRPGKTKTFALDGRVCLEITIEGVSLNSTSNFSRMRSRKRLSVNTLK